MNFLQEQDPSRPVLSVSQLNHCAKELLEQSLPLLWVCGEISNFKCYGSGHWYFSLKDENAQVRCVMFRHKNQYLDWQPKDGMQVELRALVTLYEARGDFQLGVETVRRAGLGALFESFERLKASLGKEGLFDPLRKKKLPTFPRRIGVITSPAAAALQDVLTTLNRRMPSIPVIIYPTPVQGAGSPLKIAESIQSASDRDECDTLILCRGGGSIEDLWSFNEEVVARAIAACNIPIICGVGHETDFTIADFVADARAPTPTGAAQIACPDREDLLQHTSSLHGRVERVIHRGIERRMQEIDILARRLIHPGEQIRNQFIHLQHLQERLTGSWTRSSEGSRWRLRDLVQRFTASRPDISRLIDHQNELSLRLQRSVSHRDESLTMILNRLHSHLLHLNPQSVLERGYSITHSKDGKVLRDTDQTKVGDPIKITLSRGWIESVISDTGK
jgi:exodeoxyribonuclease VII large subunit